MYVEPLPFADRTELPRAAIAGGRVMVFTPGSALVSEVATYRDELFAYLMFGYLRQRVTGGELLLEFDSWQNEKPYRVRLLGPSNLIDAFDEALAMGASPSIDTLWPASRIETVKRQTALFDTAYSLPVKRRMEELAPQTLSASMRQFIRLKSTTDPRIRKRMEAAPEPLTPADAQSLTGDIIAVAEFYGIPLDLFLGIGAMENNYMNVRGDLEHSIWKRRPAADDVVLERRRGRVRVLNDSAGVWQITRETLRYAHRLVRKDTRDYAVLPEHLRPPLEMRVTEVSPQVLTTYAGILLRDLLDHFDGDVRLAAAAYNGGRIRPNLRYAEGVQTAGGHARKVMEQAGALEGKTAVEIQWVRPN